MHLVVGLDAADGDVTAFAWAREVARRISASLEVVHVVEYEPPEAGFQILRVPRPGVLERVARERRERLVGMLAQAEGRAPQVTVTVLAGSARRELARHAASVPDAVLVVAAGRRRWIPGLLGNTTDRLLRTSDVPVLVVRGPVAERLDRVLAAVDFSPVSVRAAREAARWARVLGGSLTLFHAPWVQWSRLFRGSVAEWAAGEVGEDARALLRHAQAALAELARELSEDGLAVATDVGSFGTSPADMIAARVTEPDVDLVVMGTHGRGGLERAVLGSVAESVIRRSPRPVLVVPRRAAEAAAGG